MDIKKIEEFSEKQRKAAESYQCRIFCCSSTACVSSGSESVIEALKESVESHEIAEETEIVPTGCMGLCSKGPLVRLEFKGHAPVLYKQVEPLIARLIIGEHVAPVLSKEHTSPDNIPEFLKQYSLDMDIPFFSSQKRVVLRNSGAINPERIEDYFAKDGYKALCRVLKSMSQTDVIEEMRKADLRGRGGAGFPVAKKWAFTRENKGDEKFIICNGDEGDPGAYMDRSILEADPHAVLEGMIIAAYAVGASYGWFYIRAEYPLAIQRIQKAIASAKKTGLLGKNICGSDFSFDCEIRLGAGAFVCGEETALIASIEGKRGTPVPRPPYPSKKGLWSQPSCVNNVETLANVRSIILNGPQWFADIGTESSKGTKVFALTGKVENSGLIEVPMGTKLNTIVNEMGNNRKTDRIKGVQTGGPSGGIIPTHMLNLPVSYEDFAGSGAIMGSGGMIVLDNSDSIVNIAAYYIEFTRDESCGKCAPCRIGGQQLLNILNKINTGQGSREDIDMIKKICASMRNASLCGLGQTAPNPVISSLEYFDDEFNAKLIHRGDTDEPK